MRWIGLLLLGALLTGCSDAGPVAATRPTDDAASPLLTVQPSVIDLGRLAIGMPAPFQAKLVNRGARTVQVNRVSPSCGCADVKLTPSRIQPQRTAVLSGVLRAGAVAKNRCYRVGLRQTNHSRVDGGSRSGGELVSRRVGSSARCTLQPAGPPALDDREPFARSRGVETQAERRRPDFGGDSRSPHPTGRDGARHRPCSSKQYSASADPHLCRNLPSARTASGTARRDSPRTGPQSAPARHPSGSHLAGGASPPRSAIGQAAGAVADTSRAQSDRDTALVKAKQSTGPRRVDRRFPYLRIHNPGLIPRNRPQREHPLLAAASEFRTAVSSGGARQRVFDGLELR